MKDFEQQRQILKNDLSANLLQSLRDMTGRESAVFHGLQEVLEDVVAGESRILDRYLPWSPGPHYT